MTIIKSCATVLYITDTWSKDSRSDITNFTKCQRDNIRVAFKIENPTCLSIASITCFHFMSLWLWNARRMTFFKNVSALLMIHGVVISADFGTSIANKINVAQSAKYHNIEDSKNKIQKLSPWKLLIWTFCIPWGLVFWLVLGEGTWRPIFDKLNGNPFILV